MQQIACAGQLALNLRRQVLAVMMVMGLGIPVLTLLVMVEGASALHALVLYGGLLCWALLTSAVSLVASFRVLISPAWKIWAWCSVAASLLAAPLWWGVAAVVGLPTPLGLGLLFGLLLLTFVPVNPAFRILRALRPGVTVQR